MMETLQNKMSPQEPETFFVLLIEDNLGDIALIKRALSPEHAHRARFEVTPARSLKEGFEKFKTKTFQLVLMDLNLPDSFGLDTFRNFHSTHPEVPVVILSNLCSEEVAVDAVQLGAQDYLFKEDMHQRLLGLTLLYAIQRARLESELSAARNAAIQASRLKSDFLAQISHDVRNPLTGVVGMASLLATTPLNPEQLDFVSTILSSGKLIHGLLDDLLDISKIEAGKMRLVEENFDVVTLVQNVAHLFQPIALERGIDFSTRISEEASVCARGDSTRVKQCLINFVTNALKFTRNGCVSIVVKIERVNNAVYLRFEVTDTGPGIPQEKLGGLFHSYSQLEGTEEKGTGLGLMISKKLVDLMGGMVGVNSKVSEGSQFWFQLPLVKAQTKPEELSETKLETSRVINMSRVLIADDDEVNRKVTLSMLRRFGVTADAVQNGLEVLEAIERHQYSLILMDCHMPALNGYEASAQVKQRQPNTPVIALSGDAMPESKEQATRSGMDDFLPKPLTLSQLENCLRKWLSDI